MANTFSISLPAAAFTQSRVGMASGQLKVQTVTNSYRTGWALDDSTNEGAVSVPFKCPDGYTGSGTLKADVFFASGTNSGTAVFGLYVEAITAGSDTLNVTTADSFDTTGTNLGSTDLSGSTAGDLLAQTITVATKDSIAAGDQVRLMFYRNVATDSVTGDLFVYLIEFFEET